MRALLFLVFSSVGTVLATTSYGAANDRFAIYYSDQGEVEQFDSYRLLVLDSRHHPPLQPLAESGKLLLGYISLGEAESTYTYYSKLKQDGMLLEKNKNWAGSRMIDIRNPLWHKMVIEVLIPYVLHEGFGGVFFDTLDSPIELERQNPQKYAGMKEAAVRLIKAVRLNYPELKIMVNRAYPILPQIAGSVDMVLGESVLEDYDFSRKKYTRVKDDLYRQQVEWLKEAQQKNESLEVYTLDYADTKNLAAVAEIYKIQRANGFIPYVASIKLDKLIDEPGAL